jgi:hypothetical protein
LPFLQEIYVCIIVGHLNALIRVPFGKTNDKRQRCGIFIKIAEKPLERSKEAVLVKDNLIVASKEEVITVGYYLPHLAGHLSYHLG